ncbi:hypothetical protein [Pajaroellobacter abortibovis]|nr:hypothetical protein [Pajaroellobacter abortibovis]
MPVNLVNYSSAWGEYHYYILFIGLLLFLMVPPLIARHRMRCLLLSGDVRHILATWQSSIQRALYPETTIPLMAATAYAAYGWLEAGRDALRRAMHGPAWEAALEQRLFIETLLDTFEGQRQAAVEKAEQLEKLPLPKVGIFARRRITRLRQGLAALARAFAHRSEDMDELLLVRASRASPLVHWAMRYAAAIVAIDKGKKQKASRLIQNAPAWPVQSAFYLYHHELNACI